MSSSNPADNNPNMGPFPRQKHKILVRKWTRSPLNRHRWLAILACGHELWITCQRQPTTKALSCIECNRGQRQ